MLEPLIVGLKDANTAMQLPAICKTLGLPELPEQGSKRERLEAALAAVQDATMLGVAQRYLEHFSPVPKVRNAIQDLIWMDDVGPPILKRFRREIARSLEANDLYSDADEFDALLERLFVLDDLSLDPFQSFFEGRHSSLRAEIKRHIHYNLGDWSPEQLLARLGVFDCNDRRFRLFIEGLVSPSVRPDISNQRRMVGIINIELRNCGTELRETGTEGGYPLFTIVSIANKSTGRPKNIIFASWEKPDIRLRDAINNDIEIATNADKVLVYDRSITSDGLYWCDLQEWWAETKGIPNDEYAKTSLYQRLRSCLYDPPPQEQSPPQQLLFRSFYRSFPKEMMPRLPVLLPEVHLHWDPRTMKERGDGALPRQRMDFLLLLPFDRRIVIEVDGKHHYAINDRANPEKYADMMSADRDLRLAGYEVYRFGAHELMKEEDGARLVAAFFAVLFKQCRITPRT